MSTITTADAQRIALQLWNIDALLTPLPSEWGGTFKAETADDTYLLKIAPAHVPAQRTALEIAVVDHLASAHSGLSLPVLVKTADGLSSVTTPHGIARLYTWIPGKLWAEIHPHHPHLLEGLGTALGTLCNALQGFSHPGAHLSFDWSPEDAPFDAALPLMHPDQRTICTYYIDLYRTSLRDMLATLPQRVNYHDANDHNILVTSDTLSPDIAGFIDFGDCHYGASVHDLAICLAYALMDQRDILQAAVCVIRAFHKQSPLSPEELAVLRACICLRLVISLTHAALRHAADPANTYWQVSTASASRLLETLHACDPILAECYFRYACEMEPSPTHQAVCTWLLRNKGTFHPVTGFDLADAQVTILDWSVGSTEAGGIDALHDVQSQSHSIFSRLESEGSVAGIGRYDEPRAVYTTRAYSVPGLHTDGMRTVHLGIDVFMAPGTPLYAPLDGEVVCVTNNAGDKEYGPLVILRHQTDDGTPFYTLYGHNNIYTLSLTRPGQHIRAGEKIAEIGPFPENGNWVPHLHFQIMTSLLGYTDDFPGVADPDVRDIWLSLCPDPNLILGISHPDLRYRYADEQGLLHKRRHVTGQNLSISYKTPLHIVRGWKTHLHDAAGRKYLDTVNNIAHVGHEHPRVVHAGRQQMAVLNTNTRYLHRQMLKLSQQLLETLPGHLEVIWLVNSGSEANDLALRMARMCTGRQDTLVLAYGYHGHTQACIDVSHHKFRHLHKPVSTYVIDTPPTATMPALPETIVQTPFVFIHESLPSCAGQVVPHEEFFMDLYAEVKRSGGICIADEVQTGLGRAGSQYWAFELYTIAPDIVTIGKPLGNGHPVAAVACTRAVADAFARGPEFFSSFGGNPVSCAIASEVLSVIEDEDLQSHAQKTGAYWMDTMRNWQAAHPVIADVRGHGLFIGVEIADPVSKAPAKIKAEYLVQRMLEHRILTSLDGPHGNVLKIKPPMSITRDEVDIFLTAMHAVLQEDAMQV